ncbi:MAG TPA: hypothetical protein VL284_14140 [Thermoanaerobaculia bacterium]|nr:hypothetical protein [Thermoanaerobaculia bacterium]
MKTGFILLAVALSASVALPDATIQERTQMHFSGAVGSIINVFGRSATHEGVVSDVAIHGNRKLSRSGDTGEIVDLDQEKIYDLDYRRHTYRVVTFDELRRQYEEERARAAKQDRSAEKSEKPQGPEYEVEFSVRSTGNKETINGWPAREEIITIAIHEKGRTLEDAGGFVLTDDAWLGPRIAAKRELAEFEQRFMRKLYGDSFMADMRQAMTMMATTPAFAKAMKTLNEKQGSLEGSPVRSKMTFESVTGKNPSADQQQPQPSGLGGLLGRMRHRNQDTSSGPQRNTMFESNSELLKATTSASAEDVALPAGFTQK